VCRLEIITNTEGFYQFTIYLNGSKEINYINFNRIKKVIYAIKILIKKPSKTTSFKMDTE